MVATSPAADAALARLGEANAAEVLTGLEGLGLLASGKANLISLQAIHLALAERWEQRKTLVWQFVDLLIVKHIDGRRFTARINEHEFLIITPALSPGTARVAAANILRETLQHFLGEATSDAIVIKTATAFENDQLSCRTLSPDEWADKTDTACGQADSLAPARQWTSIAPESRDVPIVAFDGRKLRFSARVAPVIDLNHWAVAGHRIEPKLMYEDTRAVLTAQERRQLLPHDVLKMDMSTLMRGLARLTAADRHAARCTLILTVSFLALSNTNARTTLLSQAAKARDAVSKGVIWEITDFDPGAPLGRVKEIASILLPFGRSVFARSDGPIPANLLIKTCDVSGLIFPAPPRFPDPDDVAVWLLTLGRQAAGKSPTLIACNLPTKDLLPIASAAGFTHATLQA